MERSVEAWMVQMYAYLDPWVCLFLVKEKNLAEYPWAVSFLDPFQVGQEKSFEVEAEEVVQGS